ncbi:unnamed protein product [marine sediment metagenome]|uniref:Uncharacterized protein n=1 Tax=marine sediment metagenome TaxID=412755 RepID=X1QVE5_9ZZZZ
MAKIKQMKMRLGLNPDRPYQETVVAIYYDATDRHTEQYNRPIPEHRFYIKLPQIVADALGVPDARGNDQAKALENFEALIDKFKRLKTETHKVILYSFDVDPEPGKDYWDGSHRVVVWAGTFKETVLIAGDGARRYSYERLKSNINFDYNEEKDSYERYYMGRKEEGERSEHQIPWTKANEAFFLWLKERMEELIARLHELRQSRKLIEAISAGRLLPLGSSQKSD